MAKRRATILVTDDEESIRNSLREIFEFEGYNMLEAASGREAFKIIKQHQIDLMLLDIKMEGMDGLEVLEALQDDDVCSFPVIMVSGHGSIEIAVEATKKGAFDFIAKPPDLNRLLVSVRNALDHKQLATENENMRSQLSAVPTLVGKSSVIEKIKETIEKVAPTNSRVLITGENGTGKELVARWIHEKSKHTSSFVDVNCAAIPAELFESELFGHEKGAFTGASRQRTGKFEQADGGTLFLDEIGDMSLKAQSKVLRALQENVITRVGGNEKIAVDVRVIAATNKNLQQEIKEGSFREDLFHRINVIPIHIPPLRQRREDIPLLAQNYLMKLAEREVIFSNISFGKGALQALKKQPWTGNVRELQNAVERLAVLAEGDHIKADDVEKLTSFGKKRDENMKMIIHENEKFQHFKERAERLFLIEKLKINNWNISQTAKDIDIQRSHIYTKMKKYDIER